MAQVIPAYVTAMQDRSLRGHARDVYLWMHEHLDVVEYRAIKHVIVERDLGMEDTAVARSIHRLVAAGYLSRGTREGKLWTYRLVYSCPTRAADLPAKCG